MPVTQQPPTATLSRLDDERGFALPFTIFLVTIVTIMLAAAFTRSTSDHLMASNSATEVSALSVAQSGLQAFMQAGDTMTARPAPSDSFRFNVTGGYSWVYPDLMFQPADTALGFTYIIRSTGYVIQPSLGPDPQGMRTIAQFARWRSGELPGVAALVSLNGLLHRGHSSHRIDINGDDMTCEEPYSPVGMTLAFRSPTPPGPPPAGYDDGPGGVHLIGANNPIEDMSGTIVAVGDELGIDWEAATTDSILNPDYTSLVNASNYPTILINGNATLNESGTGLLVVTGDLSLVYLDGNYIQWDGIVLVGGRLIPAAGDQPNVDRTNFYGTVITGLNQLLGTPVTRNLIDGDDLAFSVTFSSCEIGRSLERFTGFRPLVNAWVDNWATY